MGKKYWRMEYCKDCGFRMKECAADSAAHKCDVCGQGIAKGAAMRRCDSCGVDCCCMIREDGDGKYPAVFTLFNYVFRITDRKVRGLPVWRSDGGGSGVVCYSTKSGSWMLGPDAEGIAEQSRGFACTVAAHDGAPPHSIRDWKMGDGKGGWPPAAVPPVGRVGACPKEQPHTVHLDRVFRHVPDRLINGCTLWRTADDSKPSWMYARAKAGKWCIIGDADAQQCFKPGTCFSKSTLPHLGRAPLEVEWECWNDTKKVNQPLALLPAEERIAPPTVLVLELALPLQQLSGRYERMPADWLGCPAWKRQDGKAFIYSGVQGAWLISDELEDFLGQVASSAPHGGRMPSQCAAWAHCGGDKKSWCGMEEGAELTITAAEHADPALPSPSSPRPAPAAAAAPLPAAAAAAAPADEVSEAEAAGMRCYFDRYTRTAVLKSIALLDILVQSFLIICASIPGAAPEEEMITMYTILQRQVAAKDAPDGVSKVAARAAQYWSAGPLQTELGGPDHCAKYKGKPMEFCSWVCLALALGRDDLIERVMPYLRTLNEFCVTRRGGVMRDTVWDLLKRNGWRVYRGGGFNMEHKDWFLSMVGKHFRQPRILAATLKQRVATKFAREQGMKEGVWPVLWTIEIDDEEPHCEHVNHLGTGLTLCEGEDEMLFPSHSVFQVVSCDFAEVKDRLRPSRIVLRAAADNLDFPDVMPRGRWA